MTMSLRTATRTSTNVATTPDRGLDCDVSAFLKAHPGAADPRKAATMRRRTLGFSLPIAFALALVVAAPAAAGTYDSSLTQTVCTSNGGPNGHGYTQGRLYLIEHGKSGTNYLRMVAYLQRFQSGQWKNVFHKSFVTDAFPDDSISNYTQRLIKFTFITADAGHNMRTRYLFQFWDKRNGPDHLLHQTVRLGPSCHAG